MPSLSLLWHRPTDARQALLDAIAARKDDGEVIAALRKLAEQNPTPSPAKSPTIFGRWKLLWASSNAEARRPMRPFAGTTHTP